MDTPTRDHTPRVQAHGYAFSGRGRLLLVAHNLDAIAATTCLRDSSEAGGNARSLEQARSLARNEVGMAGIQT